MWVISETEALVLRNVMRFLALESLRGQVAYAARLPCNVTSCVLFGVYFLFCLINFKRKKIRACVCKNMETIHGNARVVEAVMTSSLSLSIRTHSTLWINFSRSNVAVCHRRTVVSQTENESVYQSAERIASMPHLRRLSLSDAHLQAPPVGICA